jgi:DNA-binding SARP family transcriptional activator
MGAVSADENRSNPLDLVLGFGIEPAGGRPWGPGGPPRGPGSGPWGDGPDPGANITGARMRTIQRRGSVTLQVQLLGRVEVSTDDGLPLRLGGRHAQALFALLVLSRRPRSRDALATDLWPDADGASSAALRQALWLVRNALNGSGVDADTVLEVETETIGLRPDAQIVLDTDRFEACVRSSDCSTEAAVELYRGDLAEGLGHDCFAAERERLSDLYEDALSEVGEQRLKDGDLAAARRAAELLLARDSLREEAHALLISIHGMTGSRSQVVRQYRRLRAVLARELDVEPLPESEAIYRVALVRTLERSRARAALLGAHPHTHPKLVAVNA